MQTFHTGLIVGWDEAFPRGYCRGAGWDAEVAPYFRDEDRASVVIRSKKQRTAQNALELIWASLHILQSGGIDLYDYPEVVGEGSDESDPWLIRSEYQPLRADKSSLQTSGIPLACAIAARASRRRRYAYAVHLLALSQSLVAVHFMDMDPSHWSPRSAVSPYGRDHVRLAYALISAYATIEQLGLDVRASTKRPSMVRGVWTPTVRADLEERLRGAGVDLSERAVWILRGTPRRTETKRPARVVAKQSWSAGPIRDVEVEVVDAIADVSWLRSKVSSHRIPQDARSLAVYDIHNAHYIARRLLLTTLGLWRYEDVVPVPG